MSITGVLSAWEAETGNLLWKHDYRDRFDRPTPYWGASTSPTVATNKVFIHFGNDERGVLVAFDVSTGKEIWSQAKDAPSYSSPLVAEIDGVRQLIEWNHRVLVGIDLQTGASLWETPFPHVESMQNMPTPSVDEGRILLGAENRGIHCFEPKRSDAGWEVKKIWSQEKLALDMSSAVVNGAHLYGMSHYKSGRLFCLDKHTGEIMWTGPPRVGQNVTFLALRGFVVALTNQGKLQIIAADPEDYKSVQTYKVSDIEAWAAPVLVKEGFLVKDDKVIRLLKF